MIHKKYPYLSDTYFETIDEQVYKRSLLKDIDDFVNQRQYVKMTLLDWDENPLKSIEGIISSGSINMTNSSAIRRTVSLSCSVDAQSYNVDDASMDFALNKKIFIEIGVKNDSKHWPEFPIYWFPQGVFFISNFSIGSSSNSATNISLELRDKMAMLTGEIGGRFPATVRLDVMDTQMPDGSYAEKKVLIYNIIQELVHHYGKESLSNIIIEDIDLQIKSVVSWNGEVPLFYWQTSEGEEESNRYIEPHFSIEDPGGEGISIFYKGDDIGYEWKDFVITSELTFAAGDTVTTALDKIKSILGNYEYFYDAFGAFHFREIKNYMNTTKGRIDLLDMDKNQYTIETNNQKSLYSFKDNVNITSINVSPSYENIKNDYIINGKREIEGITRDIRYHLAIEPRPRPIGRDISENRRVFKNYDSEIAELEEYRRLYVLDGNAIKKEFDTAKLLVSNAINTVEDNKKIIAEKTKEKEDNNAIIGEEAAEGNPATGLIKEIKELEAQKDNFNVKTPAQMLEHLNSLSPWKTTSIQFLIGNEKDKTTGLIDELRNDIIFLLNTDSEENKRSPLYEITEASQITQGILDYNSTGSFFIEEKTEKDKETGENKNIIDIINKDEIEEIPQNLSMNLIAFSNFPIDKVTNKPVVEPSSLWYDTYSNRGRLGQFVVYMKKVILTREIKDHIQKYSKDTSTVNNQYSRVEEAVKSIASDLTTCSIRSGVSRDDLSGFLEKLSRIYDALTKIYANMQNPDYLKILSDLTALQESEKVLKAKNGLLDKDIAEAQSNIDKEIERLLGKAQKEEDTRISYSLTPYDVGSLIQEDRLQILDENTGEVKDKLPIYETKTTTDAQGNPTTEKILISKYESWDELNDYSLKNIPNKYNNNGKIEFYYKIWKDNIQKKYDVSFSENEFCDYSRLDTITAYNFISKTAIDNWINIFTNWKKEEYIPEEKYYTKNVNNIETYWWKFVKAYNAYIKQIILVNAFSEMIENYKAQEKEPVSETVNRDYYAVYNEHIVIYKESTTGLRKLAFVEDIAKWEKNIGNNNLIYYTGEEAENYNGARYIFWDNDKWMPVDWIGYYGETTDDAAAYYVYDWRTYLLLAGLHAKLHGTEQGDYFAELDAFWPEVYDLLHQKFYGEYDEKDPNTNDITAAWATVGTYYLDFIDANSSTLGEFSVSNIGRRLDVINNEDVNCLFTPEIPDVIIANAHNIYTSVNHSSLEAARSLSDLRELSHTTGYKFFQATDDLYDYMVTGGYAHGAFEDISYELYLHTRYQKTVSFTALPVFYLEPNSRITIHDRVTNTYGDFVIQSISISLGPGPNMSISVNETLERY